jgi:hypothetical protein
MGRVPLLVIFGDSLRNVLKQTLDVFWPPNTRLVVARVHSRKPYHILLLQYLVITTLRLSSDFQSIVHQINESG